MQGSNDEGYQYAMQNCFSTKHNLDIDVMISNSTMQFLGLCGVKGMYLVMHTLCSPTYVIMETLELERSYMNHFMLKIRDPTYILSLRI